MEYEQEEDILHHLVFHLASGTDSREMRVAQ